MKVKDITVAHFGDLLALMSDNEATMDAFVERLNDVEHGIMGMRYTTLLDPEGDLLPIAREMEKEGADMADVIAFLQECVEQKLQIISYP